MEKKSMRFIYLLTGYFVIQTCCQVLATDPTASPTPTPPPTTSVQIVNATSVPSISLEVNDRLDYPDFPQGELTSDAPTEGLIYRYKATNKSDGIAVSPKPITYKNMENQTLLLIGDFSKGAEEGKMPQPVQEKILEEKLKQNPPNFIARVYSHQKSVSKPPVHLRVINGMPRKVLRFKLLNNAPIDLLPGDEKEFTGEPSVQLYSFEVEGRVIPVLMNQDANPMNVNIVFYLKNNEPTFKRFFESTSRP